MTKRKKYMLGIGIAVLVFFVCIPVFYNSVFRVMAKNRLERVPPILKKYGIQTERLFFKRALSKSPRRFSLSGVHATLLFPSKKIKGATIKATFLAKDVTVHIDSFLDKTLTFSLNAFSFSVKDPDDLLDLPFERITDATWRINKPVALQNLDDLIHKSFQLARTLFEKNEAAAPFDFKGTVVLSSQGRFAPARLYTVNQDGMTTLRFDEADIRDVAEKFEIKLAQAEIDIVSTYPLRTPKLIDITTTAVHTARNARRLNPAVPEDAYRHVLWSYLLTETFGPEFAEKVTNAHETIPGNTPAERAMDYNNNAAGRKFALENVTQKEILNLVRTDPSVIRSPQGNEPTG